MSNKKESIKKHKNALSIEIRKELNLLPVLLKEKKLEKEIIYKDISKIKERINTIKKDLNKITVNILSLEKEYTSLLLKNDKTKTNQRIILNLINNEILNNNLLLDKIQTDEILELFSILFNFENEYKDEISIILINNNIEFTKLLISSYTYLKMLQNDIPQKYQQIKTKISDLVKKAKQKNKEYIYELIFSYIENILTILDNKEKNISFNNKHEAIIKKKNEIFIKLKLIEEQKIEKEEKLILISNFIKEILILIEKNNLLLNFPKNGNDINNIKNKDNNKIINLAQNCLNISCPKNTINNDLIKTDEKINIINIDLTSTSLLEKNYINKTSKKESESFDHSLKHKKFNLPKYKNITELEKDINDHYFQIKCSPLFKQKKKILKKKLNNNNSNNNSNNTTNKQAKISTNKSKEKKIEKISKNNTTMTYNTNSNEIVTNVENLISIKDVNRSYESNLNKNMEENEKIKLIENAKIIQIKNISNSSIKKQYKIIKEEKKNNIEDNIKEKINQSLLENQILKNNINNINNNKNISIKHNKTNLKKKNSFNKIKMNQSKKKLNINISNNISNNNNFLRKNSPENKNVPFLYNIINNNNKHILNKNKNKNNNNIIREQIATSVRNNSPNINNILNNNNNKSIDNNMNKNCHIIPFKKYKINYIKDKKIENKSNKKGIRINTNNYPANDRIRASYIQKNYLYNSQMIKSLPKEELKSVKKSFIKV